MPWCQLRCMPCADAATNLCLGIRAEEDVPERLHLELREKLEDSSSRDSTLQQRSGAKWALQKVMFLILGWELWLRRFQAGSLFQGRLISRIPPSDVERLVQRRSRKTWGLETFDFGFGKERLERVNAARQSSHRNASSVLYFAQ